MKGITLITLALCTLTHAATIIGHEPGDSVEEDLGRQELHLHAGSGLVTAEEQRLGEELTALERAQGRSLVADAIASFLESFRDTIVNGNDDLPPLDPLQIEHIGPFEYSSLGIRFRANIRDFDMQGLRWYNVDHVTFYALRLALGARVTVPYIAATGSYDASANILLASHQAGGNYRVLINRLQTSVDIRLGTNILGGGTLILRELDIGIVISDVQVQITGMVGSSVLNNLINSIIQSAAQDLLIDQMEAMSQMLSTELFDIVNEFLGNFTLDDLLG